MNFQLIRLEKKWILKIYLISALLILLQGCLTSESTSPNSPTSQSQNRSDSLTDIPRDPIDCNFNGEVIADGTSLTAYLTASAETSANGQCVSEVRSCIQGELTGTYQYVSCSQQTGAQSCLFNGQTILHEESVMAYTEGAVAFGESCLNLAEERVCQNGVLTGSAVFGSCEVGAPAACLFDGKTISHGESILAYLNSTGDCQKELRECQNGTLSGSFSYGSCNVQTENQSCLFNGQTIPHGGQVKAFRFSESNSQGVCESETRVCQNGVLSGSFEQISCQVKSEDDDDHDETKDDTPSPPQACVQQKIVWELPELCHGREGKGNGYFKSRISTNQGKTWVTLMKGRAPQELQEVWDKLIEKYGENHCQRPRVGYKPSRSKGYVVLDVSQYVPCEECQFEMVREPIKNSHGYCKRNSNTHSKSENHNVPHKEIFKYSCRAKSY